jgi:ABC-2 type transporter
LDSFSAMQLCDVLKKVAQQRRERPLHDSPALSSEIFNRFDRLISDEQGTGHVYQGPVPSIPDYFEVRGRPCPGRYNPADWVMDVAQSVPAETLEAEGFFPPDDRRLADPVPARRHAHDELGITLRRGSRKGGPKGPALVDSQQPPGFATQARLLFSREPGQHSAGRGVGVGARFGLKFSS